MSTATDLLSTAKNNGLLFSVEGEHLRVRWQGVPPSPDLLASIKTHKQELISLLATNDHHPQTIDVKPTFSLDRYAHLITCQQCEHLSLTSTCTLKGTQMYPDAKRDCTIFNVLESERIQIKNTPYSHSEMQGFLAKYEKPLFYHLVDCMDCDFEAAHYCPDILKVGRGYNLMLSYFDDALARREALLTQVIRARISDRRVFRSTP